MNLSISLQLIAIGLTLGSMWYMGVKSLWGPRLGMLGCIPWVAFAVIVEAWPLIAFNLFVLSLHIRTHYLWSKLGGTPVAMVG